MNTQVTHDTPPITTGRTIGWAGHYDLMVQLMTLGKAKTLRQATIEQARLQLGEIVLDVGCGTGDLTLLAKQRVGGAGGGWGIDAAPGTFRVARRKARRAGSAIGYRCEAVGALRLPEQDCDGALQRVCMRDVPGHPETRELAEIKRVLKPGGRVLIADLKRPTDWLGRQLMRVLMHGHVQRGAQDLPALLSTAGFTAIEVDEKRSRILGFVRARV